MKILSILISEFGIDKLEILKRKDEYPYEWVDTCEKFKHPSYLRKYFYSSLKDGEHDRNNGHIFLISNICTYKMFGKYLILILLKIFTIIT